MNEGEDQQISPILLDVDNVFQAHLSVMKSARQKLEMELANYHIEVRLDDYFCERRLE